MLDHVPKHFPKLCAQERGQLNFTLMVTFVLVASWISGGVSDRDQGQWEGRGGKMIEVKCVLNNQQFIVYKGNSNL